MLKKIDKRASHVGVVLSFVLFMTFVLFMYVLLEYKVNQRSGKANTLEFVENEVLTRITGEMKTVSVKLESPTASCVQLAGFLTDAETGNKLLVIDNGGNVLSKGVSGQNLQVEREGASFFRVYESAEFQSVTESLSGCQDTEYIIGLTKNEEFIFESKVLEFLEDYSANYEDFKKDLNLGARDEFGIIFTYTNGTSIRTKEQNVTIDIYANQLPIQYIKTNGAREAGTLTVIVW